MAEAISSSLNELIIGNLKSQVTNAIQLVKGADVEIEKLKRTLKRIEALLSDAEEKEATEKAVGNWLKELRDVAYDADDVLDEFATKSLLLHSKATDQMEEDEGDSSSSQTTLVLNQLMVRHFSPLVRSFEQFKLRYSTANKIKVIRERLEEVSNEGSLLKLREQETKRKKNKIEQTRLQTHSFVDESETYGRDEDKSKIIRMLLGSESSSTTPVNHHHHPHVIAVVGFGGLGKTTLAQLIYNDASVAERFELRMWVCVSDDFDVKRLIKMIIESITKEPPSGDLTMDTLHGQLRDKIKGRKFLLVLDDVWDHNPTRWESVHSALQCGAEGSKIIVTTRVEKVARVMRAYLHHLNRMSDDDCWTLFKHRAFGNEIGEATYSKLEPIGREIVKKCRGVPLAAKALGSLLLGKEENDWSYVRDSEICTLTAEYELDILPALRLSYNYLPPHLKQCFVYCSIFPKDHPLTKETLIQLWTAQGFIQSPNERRALHDIGNEYFHELLWRSFFQDLKKDVYGDIFYCKMHDLNHDLAQMVAGDECSALSSSSMANIPQRVRHLSFEPHDYDQIGHMTIPNANKVRTLVAQDTYFPSRSPTIDLILSFKYLRALAIMNYSIKELPSSFCTLIHLRYLDIAETKVEKLPKNIINLRNLQTLKLGEHLKELPQDLSYFKKLMHLEVEDFDFEGLRKMPANIGQLKFLRTLSHFIVGKESGCGIEELRGLDLHGSIAICNLENVVGIDGAKETILGDKHHLRQLKLVWSDVSETEIARVNEGVFEGLQPHPSLQRLSIHGYVGAEFPKWLMDSKLPNLTRIELNSCRRCEVLTPCSDFRFLEDLQLCRLDNVQALDFGFSSGGCPKLENLCLQSLPSLKEFASVGEEGATPMPCLKLLEIKDCPQLLSSLPSLPSLRYLFLEKSNNAILSSIAGFEDIKFPHKGMLQHYYALERLKTQNFPNLRSFTSEFAKLTSLRSLTLEHCPELICLPSGIHHLLSLTELALCDLPKLAALPEDLQHLTKLENLEIKGCSALTSLFSGMQHLVSLKKLSIWGLEELCGLPEDVEHLPNLEELYISRCEKLSELPEWLGNCQRLRKLWIQDLPNLQELCGYLPNLEELYIRRCEKLSELPEWLRNCQRLRTLDIQDLPNLQELCGYLPNLQELYIRRCEKLSELPEWLGNCQRLRKLRIQDLPNLQELCGYLPNLEELYIRRCEKLSELPEWLGNCQRLRTLWIEGCDSLRSLPDSLNAPPLRTLRIRRCRQFTSLPARFKSPPLEDLEFAKPPSNQEVLEIQDRRPLRRQQGPLFLFKDCLAFLCKDCFWFQRSSGSSSDE